MMKRTFKLKFRRRRIGKTNHRKRLNLLKSKLPRLVVRVTRNNIIAQIVEYDVKGDRTLVNTTSLELKKYGWYGHNGNCPAAYLTGLLCGKKALAKNIKEAVLDIGHKTPVKGSNVFAVLKGAIDAGMKIPHDSSCFPDEDRISGKKIEEYRKINLNFEQIKQKIMVI